MTVTTRNAVDTTQAITETNLPSVLSLYYRGKVRDLYSPTQKILIDVGDEIFVMVATDRLSAFDVVLPTPIPLKGQVLTQLSAFWFEKMRHLVPNHFISLVDRHWFATTAGKKLLAGMSSARKKSVEQQLQGRAMIVKQAQRINIECVVRGYLAGSAWADYKQNGTIHGEKMPRGLKEGTKLPEPLFTPTTKAAQGHDLPMSYQQVMDMIGAEAAQDLKQKSLLLYEQAHWWAETRGVIIADTKFEFGHIGGRVTLIDELLTPDSSRFWDAANYAPGKPQPSFDKQFVRDWLSQSGWNQEPPAPELPQEVVENTTQRYREAFKRLTWKDIS